MALQLCSSQASYGKAFETAKECSWNFLNVNDINLKDFLHRWTAAVGFELISFMFLKRILSAKLFLAKQHSLLQKYASLFITFICVIVF